MPVTGIFLLSIIACGIYFYIKTNTQSYANNRTETVKEKMEEVENKPEEKLASTTSILPPKLEYPTEGKAIIADLTEMKIRLLDNGNTTAEYPILAKGKENSRYETPVGTYELTYKEKSHKVSVKDIYMPFSMHFFGNFFIHGKPIYGNGKELFDGPSGGCIRLSNDVAEKVYEFSEKGTAVFITEDNGESDADFVYKFSKSEKNDFASLDNITATSYVVSDLKTGTVLLQKNIDQKYPTYSINKLMAVVVADESFRDDREIIIDPGINGSSTTNTTVKPMDHMTVTEILYPIIFENDDLATYSMATNIGSKYYTNLMNEKADSIGMTGTNFEDPAGLDEKSFSTARDLFNLSRYIYFKHPYISKLTIKEGFSIKNNSDHKEYSWINKLDDAPENAKLFYKSEKDGITGSITVLPMNILGEERLVSIVLLDSKSTKEISSIIDIVKNSYKTKDLGLSSEN